MQLELMPDFYLLGALSGLVVGFALGLFGAGGSILAVPLLVYAVGVDNVHVAVGTSAVAVAVNAMSNLVSHARYGRVEWRCALIFAGAGVGGAFAGSTLGKLIDGQRLLLLFAILMGWVGILMMQRRKLPTANTVACTVRSAPKTIVFGFGTGTLAGFFGIGGGFLVVPALITASGMSMLSAIGSSLFVVAAFGLTTSVNYARSGFVDWALAVALIVGGTLGGLLGTRVAVRAAARRGQLATAFATLILCAAIYVGVRALLS